VDGRLVRRHVRPRQPFAAVDFSSRQRYENGCFRVWSGWFLHLGVGPLVLDSRFLGYSHSYHCLRGMSIELMDSPTHSVSPHDHKPGPPPTALAGARLAGPGTRRTVDAHMLGFLRNHPLQTRMRLKMSTG